MIARLLPTIRLPIACGLVALAIVIRRGAFALADALFAAAERTAGLEASR